MIGMIAAALTHIAPIRIELPPTDDLWVYPHASDPATDAYLRTWGADGASIPADAGDLDSFSYSFLKWNVSKRPAGKIIGAELVLTHVADPAYSADQAKTSPVEAHPVSAGFSEKTWQYDSALKMLPGKPMFGSASPKDWPTGQPFQLVIELMKGKADFIKSIGSDGTVAIAVTSSIDPQVNGNKGVYKFFSKDTDDSAKRPVLRLTIQPD